MSRKGIEECVIKCLQKFVISYGRDDEDAERIDSQTRPLRDFGLDSQDGIDCACCLAEVGFDLPASFNPFVNDETNRPRSVGELVDAIINLCNKGGQA